MKYAKRSKLPRGLRWDATSPHICFSWRDERGSQHQQSTHISDPAEAMAFKLRFLREKQEVVEVCKVRSMDQSRLALATAADLYFAWKSATNSSGTIGREKRMFKQVEKFIGAKTPLRLIDVELIREYQEQRRKQISPTMRRAVSARSVNYELRLLRGVMVHANCWKGDVAERYKALKPSKDRIGRVATKEQLMKIIETARQNEYWLLVMYCAVWQHKTSCRSGKLYKPSYPLVSGSPVRVE
jgi:hypothetical protein